MTVEKPYKVMIQGEMRYIAMPAESEGYYLRWVCLDGTVTFMPVPMPTEKGV